MASRRWLTGLIAVLFLPTCAANSEGWKPLTDEVLSVRTADSALDFSVLVSGGPAGRFGWARSDSTGHITFERQSSKQRFLVASMVFSSPVGKIPNRVGIDNLVVALRQRGYNAVRLHYIDALLMDKARGDFEFDVEQLDRLHYLLYRLKSVGIYWIIDALTSDNGGYGDVQPHRWIAKHNAKLDVLISEEGFQHWKALVERTWGVKNPYTGTSPIQDPAMLGIILINEGAVGFLSTLKGNRYSSLLESGFRDWLRRRYQTDEKLQAAWGREAAPAESLAVRIELPSSVRGSSARHRDFARYVSDIEMQALSRMDRAVREMGFGGLTTAMNNWPQLATSVSRSPLKWIDMHAYHDLPSAAGKSGSTIQQTSLLESGAVRMRTLSNSREWGKPFSVSEYGQPFWNAYRHEASALVPAFAAHQGWSAICLFAETPIQSEYSLTKSAPSRRQAIFPFGVGADPITYGGELLAAFLFLRGDVSSSTHRVRLHVDAEALFARSGGWEQVPDELSRLAFIAPLGLDFGPIPRVSAPGEFSVELSARPAGWNAQRSSGSAAPGPELRGNEIDALRAAVIISSSNRSKPEEGLFESDTREMWIDVRQRRLQISTPRSSVIVLKGGSAYNAGFSVTGATGSALLAIASLDGSDLAHSRRMLVWVLTDAINSGMKFEDERRTRLVEIGRFPPLVRTIRATLRVDVSGGSSLKAWPLSLSGERRQEVPLRIDEKGLELSIDTAQLPDGPALFFEIASE